MMVMIKCKECEEEISKEANKCPKCGHPNQGKTNVSVIISLIVFGALLLYFFGGGLEQQTAHNLDTIKHKVISDTVKQYNIAKAQGNKIQICVQAGLVSAAYLQANDQLNYNEWKRIEKKDCSAAGL